MGWKITRVLKHVGISPSEQAFAGVAVSLFAIALLLVFTHVLLSTRQASESLKNVWGFRHLIIGWEKLRSRSQKGLGKILQVPLPSLGKKKEVVTPAAVEASIIIVLFYSFLYIYLSFLIQIEGTLYEFLKLNALQTDDLLKALGSLALAFEAVLAGSMQFQFPSNPNSGSSLE